MSPTVEILKGGVSISQGGEWPKQASSDCVAFAPLGSFGTWRPVFWRDTLGANVDGSGAAMITRHKPTPLRTVTHC